MFPQHHWRVVVVVRGIAPPKIIAVGRTVLVEDNSHQIEVQAHYFTSRIISRNNY